MRSRSSNGSGANPTLQFFEPFDDLGAIHRLKTLGQQVPSRAFQDGCQLSKLDLRRIRGRTEVVHRLLEEIGRDSPLYRPGRT
jgi:hypothetical protein